MSWAEKRLRADGRIPAAAVWHLSNSHESASTQPELEVLPGTAGLSIAQQERELTALARDRWRAGELQAVLLAAPILYGKNGSGELSEAVRLHIETTDGYCADILMPYRVRAAGRWRRNAENRVHFTHPVAQESDSRFAVHQDGAFRD